MKPIIGRSHLRPLSDFEPLVGDNQIGARSPSGRVSRSPDPRLPTRHDAIDRGVWRVRGLGGFSAMRSQTIEVGRCSPGGRWSQRPSPRMRLPVGRLHLLRRANRFEGLTRVGSPTLSRLSPYGTGPLFGGPGESSPASTRGLTSTPLTRKLSWRCAAEPT